MIYIASFGSSGTETLLCRGLNRTLVLPYPNSIGLHIVHSCCCYNLDHLKQSLFLRTVSIIPEFESSSLPRNLSHLEAFLVFTTALFLL